MGRQQQAVEAAQGRHKHTAADGWFGDPVCACGNVKNGGEATLTRLLPTSELSTPPYSHPNVYYVFTPYGTPGVIFTDRLRVNVGALSALMQPRNEVHPATI